MQYFFIYKPYGMLSQFSPDHEGQVTLAQLDFQFSKDVYPVGRLDSDSEGLLLLTNDKSLNVKLLNPKNKTPKTYWAQVEGSPQEQDLEPLRRGLDINVQGKTHHTLPAGARCLSAPPPLPERHPPIRFRANIPTAWLEIELHEGKNRQIRKMCAAIGFPVLRLVRAGMAGFRLGEPPLTGVQSGKVWELKMELSSPKNSFRPTSGNRP